MIRLFRHYIPVSLLFLGLAESLVLLTSIYLGVLVRFQDSGNIPSTVSPLFPKASLFFLVMIGAMTAMGLYQRRLSDDVRDLLFRIGLSFVLGILILSLVFYAVPPLFLGRGALALAFAVAFGGVVGVRLVFIAFADKEMLKRRILVLGAGNKANLIEGLRRRADRRGYTVVAYVHLAGEQDVVDPEKVIQAKIPLHKLAEKYCVDEIVVAAEDRRNSFPVQELLDCKMGGVDVIDLLTFFERQVGKVRLDILQPSWLIYSDGFGQGALKSYVKRTFDILVSLVLLLLTWPILVLAAAAILLESGGRGPIFYRQVRVGEAGRLFEVLKFRSMREDAEKDGVPQWASKQDDRVTPVGRFMRTTRVDELPQLINVLRGDMSFVGPRPERPHFVGQLSERIPYYSERHRVKPGITGWAQICYPYGSSEEDAREKLQYDLYYVKNYSLFLDLTVLFQTAEVILWGKGAR